MPARDRLRGLPWQPACLDGPQPNHVNRRALARPSSRSSRMCLGVPGLVTEIDRSTALVDFWGVRRRVRLDLVEEPVAVGDYVLNHVGFAIRRIRPEHVQETLAIYEQLLKDASDGEDLAAGDVADVTGDDSNR